MISCQCVHPRSVIICLYWLILGMVATREIIMVCVHQGHKAFLCIFSWKKELDSSVVFCVMVNSCCNILPCSSYFMIRVKFERVYLDNLPQQMLILKYASHVFVKISQFFTISVGCTKRLGTLSCSWHRPGPHGHRFGCLQRCACLAMTSSTILIYWPTVSVSRRPWRGNLLVCRLVSAHWMLRSSGFAPFVAIASWSIPSKLTWPVIREHRRRCQIWLIKWLRSEIVHSVWEKK